MNCPNHSDVALEEDDFDERVGVCPVDGARYTDNEYNELLKSVE